MLETFRWREKPHPIYDVSTLVNKGFFDYLPGSLSEIQAGRISPRWLGADHDVYLLNDELVVKRLKSSSREALVWQFGIDPKDVLPIQKAEKPMPPGKVNGKSIIEMMHTANADITQGLGTENFAPTVFILDQNEVFRLQPFYDLKNVNEDLVTRAVGDKFYEGIRKSWQTFKTSNTYFQWPYKMQQLYNFFGIDGGINTNALHKGIMSKPSCIIIDF